MLPNISFNVLTHSHTNDLKLLFLLLLLLKCHYAFGVNCTPKTLLYF